MGDVVEANLLAALAPAVSGEVINVASGRATSVNQLVQVIGRALGRTLAVRHAPPRPGDIIHSYADVARARKLLGYEPGVRFEKGIGQTVEYFAGAPLEKEGAQ